MNGTKRHELVFKGPYLNVKRFVLLRENSHYESYINLHTEEAWLKKNMHKTLTHIYAHNSCLHTDTNRLRRLDSHEAVIPFLPADVAKGSVVRDVLGDVGDLVDRMVVLEDLKEGTVLEIMHNTAKKLQLERLQLNACEFCLRIYDFMLITCKLFLNTFQSSCPNTREKQINVKLK